MYPAPAPCSLTMDHDHRHHNNDEAHLQDCPVCIHGFTTELHLRRHLLEHVLNCHREAEVQQGASGLHINISNIQLPYGETLLQSSLRPKRVPRKRIPRATGRQRRRQGTTPTVQYESPPRDEDWDPDTGYGDYKPSFRETPAKPQTSSETKQFRCSVCKAMFRDRQACKTHIQTHIVTSAASTSGLPIAPASGLVTGVLPTEQVRCSLCKEVFSDSQACWTHVQIHIVSGEAALAQPFLCGVCKEMFIDSQACRTHVLTHVNKSTKQDVTTAGPSITVAAPSTELLRCIVCKKVFSDRQVYETHIQTHNQKFAAPDVTPVPAPGVVTSHLPTEQFSCFICSDVFPNREVCQTHIKTHLQKSAEPGISISAPAIEHLRCDVCSEVFSDQQDYLIHMQTHSQKFATPDVTAVPTPEVINSGLSTEQFRCFICSDVFPDRELCQTHIKTHLQKGVTEPTSLDLVPDGPQIKRLRCGVCKATFRGRHVCQTAMHTAVDSTVHTALPDPQHTAVGRTVHTAQPDSQYNVQHTMQHTTVVSTKHTSVHTPQFTQPVITHEERPTPVRLFKSSQPDEVAPVKALFCCGVCSAVFDEKLFYEQHMETHNVKSTTTHPHPGPPQSTQTDSMKPGTSHPQPGPQHTQADAKLTSVESQELYRCSVCKKIFDDKISCEKHMGSHTLRTPPAPQAKSSLLRDILTRTSDQIKIATQTPVKLYRCSSCKEIFKDIASCERHTATHHLKPVPCMLCDKGCRSKADLLLHIDMVHPQVRFTKQDGEAKQQQQKVEVNVPPFDTVDKTVGQSRATMTSALPARGNAELSVDLDTTDITVKSDCVDKMSAVGSMQDVDMDDEMDSGEESDDSVIKTKHVTKKSSIESRLQAVYAQWDGESHECELCGKYLRTTVALACHIVSHHTCSECGQKFKSKDLVREHLVREHQRADHPAHMLSCKVCGATFKTSGVLERHMRSHKSTEWPPKCKVCEKVYKTERSLEVHMLTHTQERSCVCEVCGAGFRVMGHLRRHMQTHQQERRQYKCEVCGRAFYDKDRLKTHTWIHTGEKPYVCHRCGKAFRDRSTLNGHLKRVSCHHNKNRKLGRSPDGEPPPPEQVFPCEICLDAFTTRSALTRHQKTCTPSEPEQD